MVFFGYLFRAVVHISLPAYTKAVIRTQKDIQSLGAIMGIWAHPDDETWSSAGIMAAAIENEQRVCVLSATKGDDGQTADEASWSRKDLRNIRESEFGAALAAISVESGVLLHYPDNKLDTIDEADIIEVLTQHISAFAPNSILTFEPTGITGHRDHQLISKWARKAALESNANISVYGAVETTENYNAVGKEADELFDIYFATDKPKLYNQADVDICFELTEDIKVKKRKAMEAHASQTSGMSKHPVGKKILQASLDKECFIKL